MICPHCRQGDLTHLTADCGHCWGCGELCDDCGMPTSECECDEFQIEDDEDDK